jgi:tetratricopeptide (TPR) repeat protein
MALSQHRFADKPEKMRSIKELAQMQKPDSASHRQTITYLVDSAKTMKNLYLIWTVVLFSTAARGQTGSWDNFKKLEEIEKNYNKAKKSADSCFFLQNYDCAVMNYKKAHKIKPEETYPIHQIWDTGKKSKNESLCDTAYYYMITLGDNYFKQGKQYLYIEAGRSYNTAIYYKPNEQYPQEQRNKCYSLYLSKITPKRDSIKTKADSCFKNKDYECAVKYYTETHKLGDQYQSLYSEWTQGSLDSIMAVDESMIQNRITFLNDLSYFESTYKKIIGRGDKYYKEGDYEKAKYYYEEALLLKPTDSYTKTQIDTINKKKK